MSMVLHTHSRKLDYHPHVHVIIPGGGVDKHSKQWKKKKGKYLFNKKAMAKVFRARLLDELNNAGFSIPDKVPKKWVADCKYVGTGITALKYLARYLYRGVISEKNIIANRDGKITFKYIDSRTKNIQYRTMDGEDFLKLILQHVLPKGFRRVRDYGFLHSNANKLLHLVQVILRVVIDKIPQRPRPAFKCARCKSQMSIIKIRKPVWNSG
ncbi:transposase [Thermodesulfobacteriota bacterium]